MADREINKPEDIIPPRKSLHIIGHLIKVVIDIDSKKIILKEEVGVKLIARRMEH